MYIHTYNPFIRLLKVLLIIKPPSPNPKFSEYIFKRGQYIPQLKLPSRAGQYYFRRGP